MITGVKASSWGKPMLPFEAGTVHVSAFMKPNVIIESDPMVQLVLDFVDWRRDELSVEVELQFSGGADEGAERTEALRSLFLQSPEVSRSCVLAQFPSLHSIMRYAFSSLNFWGQFYDMIQSGDRCTWYKWSLRGRPRQAGWDGKTMDVIAGLLFEMRQAGFIYSAAAPFKPWIGFLREHGITHGCKFL